jgi:hypothetical protein
MLELMHDAFDGFLLRLGFARRHCYLLYRLTKPMNSQ